MVRHVIRLEGDKIMKDDRKVRHHTNYLSSLQVVGDTRIHNLQPGVVDVHDSGLGH